jgi:hypothetical protein
MPNYGNTTFRGLRKLLGNNPISDVDAGFAALADDVDAQFGSRGKSIIATEESRTNTAYGTLTTPDQVTGIVVPADAFLFVSYRALVKQSVASAATLAIFLSATQAKYPSGSGAPALQETGIGADVNDYNWAYTLASGTLGWVAVSGAGDASSVTTGLFAAQGLAFDVAAGTYDVTVQYKASSGSVTAKDRRLRVWTLPF